MIQLILMGVQWCKVAMMLRPVAFMQAQAMAMFEGMGQWWSHDEWAFNDQISENVALSAVFRTINAELDLRYQRYDDSWLQRMNRWEKFSEDWKQDCDKQYLLCFGEAYREVSQRSPLVVDEEQEEEYRLRHRDLTWKDLQAAPDRECRARVAQHQGKDRHKQRKHWGRHKV